MKKHTAVAAADRGVARRGVAERRGAAQGISLILRNKAVRKEAGLCPLLRAANLYMSEQRRASRAEPSRAEPIRAELRRLRRQICPAAPEM